MRLIAKTALLALLALAAFQRAGAQDWNEPGSWDTRAENDGMSKLELSAYGGGADKGVKADFDLTKPGHAYVVMRIAPEGKFDQKVPVVFNIKADAACTMELKMVDEAGTTYWKKIALKDKYKDWKRETIYLKDMQYAWGADQKFGKFKYFGIGFSGEPGTGGTVIFTGMGFGKKGEKTTMSDKNFRDRDANLGGFGFEQRRDKTLNPENPLVLEWLKVVQDQGSKEKQLLPSNDIGDTQAQTFNNALVAMAFIIEGEQERAERILDFFANAVKQDNEDKALQNFFYKGEARGFYQHVSILDYRDDGKSDRWMGDMCWLMLAYKYYDLEFKNHRYDKIEKLIMDLLKSWYKPAKVGGYLQHGWRSSDSKLHESYGHAEGNIDAYAVMKLCGEKKMAEDIRRWLDANLGDKAGMPLDLYTWRVQAEGRNYGWVLNKYVDGDTRFVKTLDFFGNKVKGVWHSPDEKVNNIWVDGVGQLACAYFEAGDWSRGNFYANQMDNYMVDRTIDGKLYKILPYGLTKEGGFEWIKFDKGFISCAAWYIFAKNQFNPMKLKYYHYENKSW